MQLPGSLQIWVSNWSLIDNTDNAIQCRLQSPTDEYALDDAKER